MAIWLKKGAEAEAVKSAAHEVPKTVEKILADIEKRGDAAGCYVPGGKYPLLASPVSWDFVAIPKYEV